MTTLLLTIPEAAAELRVSRQTVYRRIASGAIQTTDVAEEGSSRTLMRIPRAALLAYATGATETEPEEMPVGRPRKRRTRKSPKSPTP